MDLHFLQTYLEVCGFERVSLYTFVLARLRNKFLQLILITLETSFLKESIATREREEAMWNLNALPKGTIVTAPAGRELRAFRTWSERATTALSRLPADYYYKQISTQQQK